VGLADAGHRHHVLEIEGGTHWQRGSHGKNKFSGTKILGFVISVTKVFKGH